MTFLADDIQFNDGSQLNMKRALRVETIGDLTVNIRDSADSPRIKILEIDTTNSNKNYTNNFLLMGG